MSDRSLSIVGSVASAFNCAGRLFWGQTADKFGPQNAMALLCILWSVVLLLLPLVSPLGSTPYSVLVCCCFFLLGGNFSIFPAATSMAFGSKYFGVIYGFMYSSQLVASTAFALIAQNLGFYIGPAGLCIVVACFCKLSCIWVWTSKTFPRKSDGLMVLKDARKGLLT